MFEWNHLVKKRGLLMRKIFLFAALFSLTFLLACGSSETDEVEEQPTFDITAAEKVDPEKVVMQLNGEEVLGDRYNLAYLQIKVQLFQYGQDVSNLDDVKELAIEALIEQEVLLQDATEKGIEVADADVEAEMELIKTESLDSFETFLETYKFDEESYKMMLSFAMLYDQYVKDQFADIDVAEEEIEDAYAQLKSENEELADLADIKDSLRAGLIQQKENEMVQERIDDLKEQAEIEMNI